MDEKTLDFLQQQIPSLVAAVTIAYNDALAAGYSVLKVEGDELIEQFPDGTKRVIEKLGEDKNESL